MAIQSWWILFSFLQSATTFVIDRRLILATNDDIGFEEWIWSVHACYLETNKKSKQLNYI